MLQQLANKVKGFEWRRLEWTRNNDRQWGPFLYSKDGTFKQAACILESGDGEDYKGCTLRLAGFGHTFIVALPPIVKPEVTRVKATYWDEETIKRLGRDWYEETHERRYGFTCHEGFFQLYYGAGNDDCSRNRRMSWFLPWRQWRHVRHSLYDLNGVEVWRDGKGGGGISAIKDRLDAREACPAETFAFKDYDGEAITATTRVEEREWQFGDGWFKWLSWFRAPRIIRSLEIDFSSEVGREKGSWKGGTVGHSIEMEEGEMHEAAFKRYCEQHSLTLKAVK